MCGLSARPALSGGNDWPEFVDQTAALLFANPSVGVNDDQEKDYAWGDVDQDGDIDLVCVRKQPFTTPGRRVNILLINEGGVLVDRTADFATASDVPGDNGFHTPTNDRDVVLVDLDGDGWLDMVTATTLTDNEPKHLSHPRVYMNLRDDPPGSGNWRGFEYQGPTWSLNPWYCSRRGTIIFYEADSFIPHPNNIIINTSCIARKSFVSLCEGFQR